MAAAVGVGGPKLLQTLNNAGYLPSYDTRRRHAEGAPNVRPNEPPCLHSLLEALSHIAGVHVWHLCIDEIHVEDAITVSREALAVALCATCCGHAMPLATGDDGCGGCGTAAGQEPQIGLWAGYWPFLPLLCGKLDRMLGNTKEKRQKDKIVPSEEKVEKEKKEGEEKEKKQKEKRPKDKIVPCDENVENEKKEKEKDKEREGRPTLAALMEERLLRSMPRDELGVLAKPRRPAFWPTDRPTRRRFSRSKGHTLSTTVPQRCFSTPLLHYLLSVFMLAHSALSWRQSKRCNAA